MRLSPLLPLFLLLAPRRPLPCRRVFDQPAKITCEVVMNAKTIGLILAILLLTIPILACGGIGGGSDDRGSGGATSRVGGDDEVLKLLPEDTTRIRVAAADAITGGSVPESMAGLFEAEWERYSLGGEDEIVTIDDIGKIVWAYFPDGAIMMLGGSRMDFAAINQWLADEDTNIAKTSYQGQEMWQDDFLAMAVLSGDGYLVLGTIDEVKELLKVKARGSGSLAADSENSLKKAYEDAASGWYVSASSDCDEISGELRSCEAYSITAGQGDEDYLVDVTYRFVFRSEQRAESQALDIEDWIDDRGYRWDIDEIKTDGVAVEAMMSGDEEDFKIQWIGTNSVTSPPHLETATPEPESRNTNQGGPASEPGATSSPPVSSSATPAPTATTAARATATPAPTMAPTAQTERVAQCRTRIWSQGSVRGTFGGCWSSNRNNRYAHYYIFSLERSAYVTIDLKSDSGTDEYLLLLEGEGSGGRVLVEDNDGGGNFSRIAMQLPRGTYTIEATTYEELERGDGFTLHLSASTLRPTAAPTVTWPTAVPPTSAPAPTATIAPTPAPVAAFGSVSTRGRHTCGVKTSGSVDCWGDDRFGQATPPGGSFSSVSAGAWHTCGVKTSGSVDCWGSNNEGQAAPPGGSFSSVSSGGWHTCGVKADGSVDCWGNDDYDQAAPPGGSFSSVSASFYHNCGVKTDGSVACWGADSSGRAAPPRGSFSSVSAGGSHTCGVRTDGSVACWGADSSGQATPPGGSFSSVSAGNGHTCGVKTGGSVACWGMDEYGEATPPGGSFSSVSAGGGHTCGVKTDGSVACWGSEDNPQATPAP